MKDLYLNKTQFNAELEKCLKCPTKPCMKACPVHCSPYDFIALSQQGDLQKAARSIARQNVLGEVCGLICPDRLCVKACLRARIDYPIRIPAVQAYIMKNARESDFISYSSEEKNNQKIAVIGSGPAAMGAIAELLRLGYRVEVFEKDERIGGALNLIPKNRLPREVLEYEWGILSRNERLTTHFNTSVKNYRELTDKGFAGVIVAVGEQKSRSLLIDGENLSVSYVEYLSDPEKYASLANVAIIGGGLVAVDCAITAKSLGAKNVEMFVRRRFDHMRITQSERQLLLDNAIDITTMTRVVKIEKIDGKLAASTVKTRFDSDGKLEDVENTLVVRKGFDQIVLALGSTRDEDVFETDRILFAGDVINGGTTAVEAVASGKNAARQLMENLKN